MANFFSSVSGMSPAKVLYAVTNGEKAAIGQNSDVYIYVGNDKLPSRVLDCWSREPRPFKRGEQRAHRRK